MYFFFHPNSLHLAGFIAPSGMLPSFLVPAFLPFPFGFNGDDRHTQVWEKTTVFIQSGVPPHLFVEIEVDTDSVMIPWHQSVKFVDAHLHAPDYPGPYFMPPFPFEYEWMLNGGLLYAFGKSKEAIWFGRRHSLAARLVQMANEFADTPFLYLEVCQFAESSTEIPSAISRAKMVLNEHNPTLASQWAHVTGDQT